MSARPHDLGIVRERLRREIDDISGRRAKAVEPVARGLEGHAEMDGAKLARREVRYDEQRPAPAKILGLEATNRAMITAPTADRPAPPVKQAGMGRSTARRARIVKRITLLRLIHGNALGLGPQVRRGRQKQSPAS